MAEGVDERLLIATDIMQVQPSNKIEIGRAPQIPSWTSLISLRKLRRISPKGLRKTTVDRVKARRPSLKDLSP